MEPEHEHYREKVRRVLDSGIPIKRYRTELDSEARRLLINKERQSRIESDLLRPLGPQHFLLLPALIFSPLLGIFAFFRHYYSITDVQAYRMGTNRQGSAFLCC